MNKSIKLLNLNKILVFSIITIFLFSSTIVFEQKVFGTSYHYTSDTTLTEDLILVSTDYISVEEGVTLTLSGNRVQAKDSSIVENDGLIVLQNDASLEIWQGAGIINTPYAVIDIVDGTIFSSGYIQNQFFAIINVKSNGGFANNGGGVVSNHGGEINILGTFNNAGGTISNNCGKIYGAISGPQPEEYCPPPTINSVEYTPTNGLLGPSDKISMTANVIGEHPIISVTARLINMDDTSQAWNIGKFTGPPVEVQSYSTEYAWEFEYTPTLEIPDNDYRIHVAATNVGLKNDFEVIDIVLDRTAPQITVPSSLQRETTDSSGYFVNFEVMAQDDAELGFTIDCDKNSGDKFPIGITTVTCTAIDTAGNEAMDSFIVEVIMKEQVILEPEEEDVFEPEQEYQDEGIVSGDIEIPHWIKSQVEWWVAGSISEREFIDSIEYLIQNEIIVIPESARSEGTVEQSVPDWVKNNARWWTLDLISDSEFAMGLQYLIKVGIIII